MHKNTVCANMWMD